MSYYYFGDGLCPGHNLGLETSFLSHGPYPLLFLYETFPALIVSAHTDATAPLPVYRRGYPAPEMLGGSGAMFYSFITERNGSLPSEHMLILKDALNALDVAATVYGDSLTVDGRPCSCGSAYSANNAVLNAGVLYYGTEQALLERVFGRRCPYISLSDINPGLSRSYLFGAVRYSFELVYGKAERAALPPAPDALSDLSG